MVKMALVAGFVKSVKTDIEGRFIVQKKIIGSLLVSMAMPFSAFALSLGDVEVYSSLNQPLDAEIEIKSATARDVNKLIVKLASEQKFIESGINRPFWLTGLKFSPITKSGKSYIKITSSSAVREPFLNFLVDAEWPSGRLVREYTILVDPPSFVTSAPVVTQTQAPVQAQPSAQQGIAEIKRSELIEETPVFVESEPVVEVETFEELSVVDEALPNIDLSMDVDGDLLDTQTVTPIETVTNIVEAPEPVQFDSEPVKFDDYVVVGDSDYLDDSYLNGGVEDKYTVQGGDTMSSIARQYVGNGVSLNQVMVAILKANPKAFINDNVNLVKRGARLNIPSHNDIVALSRSKALEIVKQQNALWREYRNKSVATTPTIQPELTPVPQQVNDTVPEVQQVDNTAAPTETPEAGAGDNQLSIVAPKTPKTAKDNAELSLNDDNAVEDITRKLLLARERVAATNLREEELQSRISELEGIATQSKAVLALKNQKLAQMQANAEGTESNDINLDSMFGALEDDESNDEQTAVENTTEQVQEPTKTETPETPVASVPEATPTVDVNRPDGFLGTVYDFIPTPVKELISPYLGSSTTLAVLVILGALICLPLLVLLRKKKSTVTKGQTEGALDVNEFAQSDSLSADTTAELESTDGFNPEAFAASGVSDQVSQDDLTGLSDLDAVPDETPVSSDDLEMSDATGVTVETSDPDVVDDVTSEADMYVVYGLHDQAVELLRKSIRENPEKAIYYSKLMEVYKDQDKQLEFLEVAEDLKTMLNGKPSTSWDYAVTLGKEYAPEAGIFAGVVATAAAGDETSGDLDIALDNDMGDMLDDASHDLDMDELLAKTEASGTPESSDSVFNPEEMLADMDLDGASADDAIDEMSDQDIADISMGLTDDNIELDVGVDSALLEESDLIDDVLGDAEDVKEALTEIPEITSAIEADGLDETIDPSMFDEMNDVAEELTKEADSLGDNLDGMDGLDLDSLGALDDDILSTTALDGEDEMDDGEMTQLIDDDSLETMIDEIDTDVASFSVTDADSGFDEIGTKLDLAKAYIDMGDAEGAKESLQEVIQGGNDEQKAEAEKLLSEI